MSCGDKHRVVMEDEVSGIKEVYYINEDSLIHGLKKVYMKRGEILIEEANYINGQLDGDRFLYRPNGAVEVHEQYASDVLDGMLRVFHMNGTVKLEMNYDNGNVSGIVKQYYDTGELSEEVTFVDNMEQGPFTEFYKNGSIKWKGTYLNGDNEFGLLEHFDSTGLLIKTLECDSMAICKTTWSKTD